MRHAALLRRAQHVSHSPRGVPDVSLSKAASPCFLGTTGRRATTAGGEPGGDLRAHSCHAAIPAVGLRRRRWQSTHWYAHILPRNACAISFIVALCLSQEKRPYKGTVRDDQWSQAANRGRVGKGR